MSSTSSSCVPPPAHARTLRRTVGLQPLTPAAPPSRRSHAFVAGAVAGAVDTCFTMPLDTVKTKMQLQRFASPMACSRAIVASDGVHGLYYGFRPFLIQASGKAAVRFCIYDNLVRLVDMAGADRAAAPAKWSMVCGMGAGMGEALLWTSPTERLKVPAAFSYRLLVVPLHRDYQPARPCLHSRLHSRLRSHLEPRGIAQSTRARLARPRCCGSRRRVLARRAAPPPTPSPPSFVSRASVASMSVLVRLR